MDHRGGGHLLFQSTLHCWEIAHLSALLNTKPLNLRTTWWHWIYHWIAPAMWHTLFFVFLIVLTNVCSVFFFFLPCSNGHVGVCTDRLEAQRLCPTHQVGGSYLLMFQLWAILCLTLGAAPASQRWWGSKTRQSLCNMLLVYRLWILPNFPVEPSSPEVPWLGAQGLFWSWSVCG